MHGFKSRARAVTSIACAVLLLTGTSAATASDEHETTVLSPSVDPHPDLIAIADARGWTLDEAAAQQRAADAVGAVATKVSIAHPEVFVGSAVADNPGGVPTLYIKGEVSSSILELLEATDIDIALADNQPFSFDELEERKVRVHRALEALGYRNVVTRVNIAGRGVIPAAVATEPGLPTQPAEILAAMPEDLRASIELSVEDPTGFRDTTSFGGMWVRDDGANECTSGYTVRSLTTGAFGITTAGHCGGINRISHPGHGVHTTGNQQQHRGDYGDVEWHTTNVGEEATFYAETTTIRPVLYLEARASISVGEQVCQYGRASDFRDCDYDVHDVSIACTLSGVYNNRLVQMTGITSTFGDSGGPWFRDYRVFGSQKGWCGSRDAWSVADLYDEALDVHVVIYE